METNKQIEFWWREEDSNLHRLIDNAGVLQTLELSQCSASPYNYIYISTDVPHDGHAICSSVTKTSSASRSSLHGLQVGDASYGVSSIQKKPHQAIKQMILDSGFFKFMTQHPLDKEDFIKAIRLAPDIKEDFHTILSEKNSIEKLIKFVNEDELMKQMVV